MNLLEQSNRKFVFISIWIIQKVSHRFRIKKRTPTIRISQGTNFDFNLFEGQNWTNKSSLTVVICIQTAKMNAIVLLSHVLNFATMFIYTCIIFNRHFFYLFLLDDHHHQDHLFKTFSTIIIVKNIILITLQHYHHHCQDCLLQ